MDLRWTFALVILGVLQPLNSALSGSHVCSRTVSKRSRYTTCCNWSCWSRCTRYRTGHTTQQYCCHGWRADSHGGCSTPICSRRCQNGGTCVGPDTCKCDDYHSGNVCERTVAYCGKRPCQNGGTCVAPESCSCDLFHYGNTCQFKKSCNNKTLELLFVIDSSGSIGQPNFDKLQSFVKLVIEQFDVSQNKTRIGLITFSRYPVIRFGLSDTTNTSDALNAVDAVPYIPGVTDTYTALHLLHLEAFEGSRPNVPHVAILITAGTSLHSNETEAIAQTIHRQGDRISKEELHYIATDPDDKHLIFVHNYTMLNDVLTRLTTLTCDVTPHTYTPSATQMPIIIQHTRRKPISECSGKIADIVLLLDSSQDLGNQHFKGVEHFALDVVNDLDVGENATLIGVISFSTYPVRRVTLGSTDDKLQILNLINQIPYYTGTRELDKALQMLRIEGFEGERPHVPKLVILITAGNSTSAFLTGRAADELKQAGIELFVVGIGNTTSKQELERISSGGSNHVFTVPNFLELDMSGFEGIVAQAVCQAIPTVTTVATTLTTTLMPVITTKSTATISTTGSTTMTPAKAPSECMPDVKDIMFLVDSSGSIGDDNFEHVKNFIKQTIKTFEIGPNKTRIGLILFNSNAAILFPLDRYDSQQSVLTAVGNIIYRPGGTNTAAALELLRTQGFTNARPAVPKIAFLITDGYSTDRNATEKQAMLAKENNTMQIFATGVGQLLDFEELRIVASTNPTTNKSLIYHVEDFDELHVDSLEQILANVICGADLVSTSTMPTTQTTTPTSTPSCADTLSNCDDYQKNMCTDYRPWAMAHCELYCGFCQGPSTVAVPCIDTVANCREYGHDICTSETYRKWTKEHCARFCEVCGVDILVAPNATHSTTAIPVPLMKSTTTDSVSVVSPNNSCTDKLDNCDEYGLDTCTDYAPWATEHCKHYCGICKGATTTAAPCVDTVGNCHEYPPDICTSVPFIKWTKEHCARYCKLCDAASP